MESNEIDEQTALKVKNLCGQFLGENWIKNEIEVKKIVVGVANQIYHCSLNKTNEENVIVRINGSEFFNSAIEKMDIKEEFIFNGEAAMVIISAVVADSGLAPQILGVFEGGRIEQFIEGRNLNVDDFCDLSLYALIAKMLAKYHSLSVPVRRRPLTCESFSNFEVLPEPDYSKIDSQYHKSIKDLFSFPLLKEGKWSVEMAHKLNSRIVFAHNDLHLNNIILKKKFDTPDKRLIFLDFDLSRYNYRGYDFAFFMNNVHEFLVLPDKECVKIVYTGSECPEDVKRLIVEEYLIQWKQENSNDFDNEIDSYEQISKEIDFFGLQHYLLLISFTQFLFMDTTRTMTYSHIAPLLERYWQRKQLFETKHSNL